MRNFKKLIVRGEAPEVEKFVGRIEADAGNGRWKREPTVEAGLKGTSIGRLGASCYSWRGGEGRPAAYLLIYRTGPGELSLSNIVPAVPGPLTDEEYNSILSTFKRDVLGPMSQGLAIETTVVLPRNGRLELSLSPDAFRELIRFISEVEDPEQLTIDDQIRWDHFWIQSSSDGSLIDDKDLGDWLTERGLSDRQASALIERGHASRMAAPHGGP